MESELRAGLTRFLSEYITDHKKDLIESVLQRRTRYITVALEDIYQSQNASAVIRTCECLGIQDLNIIENKNEFNVNQDVVIGASKWINLNRYNEEGRNNTKACFKKLSSEGYRLVGTSVDAQLSLNEFEIEEKIALIFGTEMKGLSQYAKEKADVMIRIPMYGFTESYNISVSAAILLYNLITKLKESNKKWGLSETEKDDLRLSWYRKVLKNGEKLEKAYLSSVKNN